MMVQFSLLSTVRSSILHSRWYYDRTSGACIGVLTQSPAREPCVVRAGRVNFGQGRHKRITTGVVRLHEDTAKDAASTS